MDNTTVLNKVNKLLALSESSNEFEASSALLKAQELLAKHNMTLADMEFENAGKDILMYGSVSTDYTSEPWRLKLASVIANHFKCYAIGRRKLNAILFIGLETDVSICQSIYAYAVKFIEDYCISNRGTKESYAKEYANGFIDGLDKKLSDQVKENKWELALTKSDATKEAYEDFIKDCNIAQAKIPQPMKMTEAYENGYEDGRLYSPYTLESQDSSPSFYIAFEFKKNVVEFLQYISNTPKLECFRQHPAYKTKKQMVEQIYKKCKELLNGMENLENQLRQNEEQVNIKQYKLIRYHCQRIAVAFYRAYYTPQNELDVKSAYETQYVESLRFVRDAIESSIL